MINSKGKRQLVTLLCGVCSVCHGLFAIPFDVIGWLCCVIVALSQFLPYYLFCSMVNSQVLILDLEKIIPVQTTLFIPTLDTTTKFVIMTI